MHCIHTVETLKINPHQLDSSGNMFYCQCLFLDMVGKVHDCTKDEVMVVNTNGRLKNFTNISPLRLLRVDIYIMMISW